MGGRGNSGSRSNKVDSYREVPAKEQIVNFGNSDYMKEMVTYEGAQMPRKDARRIDKIKDDLGFLSYRAARTSLTEEQKSEQAQLQDELRKYGKKYNISVGFYLPGGR